ncbi:phospholipase SGR2-like isoform X4 [Gossypium australe]|uniref:Phospholipase SGR2-like isoform X4 n=1 Tax=Gossypium australe TaxID=47621 RepID=A0A5B6WTL2_9ROSI|nr:phospholipase SGR2-like isoform X4 [Gossypium australe]
MSRNVVQLHKPIFLMMLWELALNEFFVVVSDVSMKVSNQLNRLYLKFLKRNPGYDGKVSIYGHSLGSVLSYDILCHQENLSSLFPVQCLYEKDSKDLECSPDMIDQSFKCSSLANLEKNDSTMMTKDIVDCLGEEILLPNPSVIEGHVEDKSSVSTKSDVAAEDPMQKSCKEDVHQLLNDFSGAPWLEESGSGETTEVDFVVSDGCLETATEEEHEEARDRDKTIKMLKEEIDSLKAKIAELESNNSEDIGENKEMLMQKPPMLQKFDQKLPLKLDDATKSYTPYIRYTKLEFKVDTFFAVGSPLGVFLALRNIRIGLGKGQDYWDEENISEEMPACRQMFNIFHPFDPVAYRVEPLVCKEYITKRPVIIPYHKGGKRLHIGFQEFTEHLAARSHVVMNHFSTVRVSPIKLPQNCFEQAKVLTACQSRDTDNLEGEENVEEKEEMSYGSLMIERLTGSEGRIDHVLQILHICGRKPSHFEARSVVAQSSAKAKYRSITQGVCELLWLGKVLEELKLSKEDGLSLNYWRDYDTALFILKHLYRDIPEDPNFLGESIDGSLKDENASMGWSDERETIDEELPLTFSDRDMVKNFSRKAKKFIKKP